MLTRNVILTSRPAGIPQAEHFAVVEAELPGLDQGQVLVRNRYLSVDPAMRGWVSAEANYATPVGIGEVMRASAAGEVIESRDERLPVGTRVIGSFGWREHAVVDASSIERIITTSDLPLSAYLGVLGMTGATAWFGLLSVGQPQVGDTVVVSTAAGAVGSVVGQLAKLAGCRTVGITGGPVKVGLCRDEFGYDAAVDYKADSFIADLTAACPGGVDVYYDNTAGAISDAVHTLVNRNARIVICGTASVASWIPVPAGLRMERLMLTKSARMQGFTVMDFQDRLPEAYRRLEALVRSGQLRYREEFLDGIESAPDAIAGLYRGENLGRRLIRLHD